VSQYISLTLLKYSDREQKLWAWKYRDEARTVNHTLYYEPGEEIRIQVNGVKFQIAKQDSTAPKKIDTKKPGAYAATMEQTEDPNDPATVPMIIAASANEDTLGMTAWWQDTQ
jgi:hypothetical protein